MKQAKLFPEQPLDSNTSKINNLIKTGDKANCMIAYCFLTGSNRTWEQTINHFLKVSFIPFEKSWDEFELKGIQTHIRLRIGGLDLDCNEVYMSSGLYIIINGEETKLLEIDPEKHIFDDEYKALIIAKCTKVLIQNKQHIKKLILS